MLRISVAVDELTDVRVPWTLVILAARDELFVVVVAEMVSTRPAREDERVVTVFAFVVMLAARDELFVVVALVIVSKRPAAEEL
jgi:hypothetical protein